MFAKKYSLQFILHLCNSSLEALKGSLSEFGGNIEMAECLGPDLEADNFKVCMVTEDPTLVFDVCGQFGRIREVKVDEIKS